MSTIITPASAPIAAVPTFVPAVSSSLEPGDHLTRAEFERRYSARPDIKKAELIEGVVYLCPATRFKKHGRPHALVSGWLGIYEASTPGVEGADSCTVRLDLDNEPQPDAFLRIEPSRGGQSRTSEDDFIEGAPELIAEITASSVSYDLHSKMNAYRRNGVREYVVILTEEQRVLWWVLRDDQYVALSSDPSGILRSEVFPGLWLDTPALLAGNLAQVLAVLDQGLTAPEHSAFVERLQQAAPR